LFNEFNKVVMPSTTLNDEEITAIFAYVKEEEARAAAVQAPAAPGAEAAQPEKSPWTLLLVFSILVVLAIILNRVKKGLEHALLAREGKPLPAKQPARKTMRRWVRGNKKLVAVILLMLTAWHPFFPYGTCRPVKNRLQVLPFRRRKKQNGRHPFGQRLHELPPVHSGRAAYGKRGDRQDLCRP
jgi:hypothetical protein